MSDHNAIHDMSRSLSDILHAGLNPEGEPPVKVSVDSPHSDGEEPRVNLFLYQVFQDPQRRNVGRVPIGSSGRDQRFVPEPLALKLRYLLTAYAQDGLSEQRLLGRSIQLLHGSRLLPRGSEALYGSLGSGVQPPMVKIVLTDVEPELLQSIWGSQGKPLKPSVAWEVECIFIEEEAVLEPLRVVESIAGDVIPVPYLSYVYPSEGLPGAEVELRGANLAQSFLSVWFGDVRAELLEPRSSRRARVIVPPTLPHGVAPVQLRLDTYRSSALDFRVGRPSGPWVYRLLPDAASPGATMLLGGQDLDRPGLMMRLGEGVDVPLEDASPEAAEITLPSLEALGLTEAELPYRLPVRLIVGGVTLSPLYLQLILPADPE